MTPIPPFSFKASDDPFGNHFVEVISETNPNSNITWQDICFMVYRSNPTSFKEARKIIHLSLQHLCENASTYPKEWVPIFTYQMLSLYIFLDPSEEELLTIPQYENATESWKLASYQVSRIALSFMKQKQELFALELKAPEKDPILIFRGTPPPCSQGFLSSLITDFTPFHGVGETLFRQNFKFWQKWMEEKNQVIVCGQSLGGSLAYHLASHWPEKVFFYTFGSPGLFRKTPQEEKMRGFILTHEKDLIFQVGRHPESPFVKLYQVSSERRRNWFTAHMRGVLQTNQYRQLLTSIENTSFKRRVFTIIHQCLSAALFVFLVALKVAILLLQCFFSIPKYLLYLFKEKDTKEKDTQNHPL